MSFSSMMLMIEQAPQSVLDFVRQRRRWFLGLVLVTLHAPVRFRWKAALVIGNAVWSLSWLSFMYTVANLVVGYPAPLPVWMAANTVFTYYVCTYVVGMRANLLDRPAGFLGSLKWYVLTLAFVPYYSLLEALGVLYAIVSPDFSFHVVQKNPRPHREDAAPGDEEQAKAASGTAPGTMCSRRVEIRPQSQRPECGKRCRRRVDPPVGLLRVVEPDDGFQRRELRFEVVTRATDPGGLVSTLLRAARLGQHDRLPPGVGVVHGPDQVGKVAPAGPGPRGAPVVGVDPDPVDVGVSGVIRLDRVPRHVRDALEVGRPDPDDVRRAGSVEQVVDSAPRPHELCGTGRAAVARAALRVPVPVHLPTPAEEHGAAEPSQGNRPLRDQIVPSTGVDLSQTRAVPRHDRRDPVCEIPLFEPAREGVSPAVVVQVERDTSPDQRLECLDLPGRIGVSAPGVVRIDIRAEQCPVRRNEDRVPRLLKCTPRRHKSAASGDGRRDGQGQQDRRGHERDSVTDSSHRVSIGIRATTRDPLAVFHEGGKGSVVYVIKSGQPPSALVPRER